MTRASWLDTADFSQLYLHDSPLTITVHRDDRRRGYALVVNGRFEKTLDASSLGAAKEAAESVVRSWAAALNERPAKQ